MTCAPRGTTAVGRAWLIFTFALLLHVADEALTGFLSVYNPTVIALRERVPWLPMPTFGFGPWLAGLLAAVAALLLASRSVYRGARWPRPVGYGLAGIMIFNSAAHVAATVAGRTVETVRLAGAMPGVYSSPLLLAASVYLVLALAAPAAASKIAVYAAAAAVTLAGAVSLALFGAFLWAGSLELVPLPMRKSGVLAWDALLCGVFFAQHSGMVRRRFRAWLGRFVPGQWHGAVYTLASAAALLLLTGLWQRSGVEIAAMRGYAGWTIRAVFLAGIAVFAWAVRSLRSFDVFGVQALRGKPPDSGEFVTAGPYRWVRHPFYISAIMMIWACPLLTLDRLLFDVLWTCWIIAGARLEERDLAAGFGDAYRAYRREVPMLVPLRRPR